MVQFISGARKRQKKKKREREREKGMSGGFWVIQRAVLGAISALVEHSNSPATHTHTHQSHVLHTRPSRCASDSSLPSGSGDF